MKRLSFLIALMIAANWSGPARAETNILAQCVGTFTAKSITYNEFGKASDVKQRDIITFWLSGFVSGLSLKSDVCSDRISACLDNTSASQRLAMLEKDAKDSPEKWGADHFFTVYRGSHSLDSKEAELTRISQTTRCIGAENLV